MKLPKLEGKERERVVTALRLGEPLTPDPVHVIAAPTSWLPYVQGGGLHLGIVLRVAGIPVAQVGAIREANDTVHYMTAFDGKDAFPTWKWVGIYSVSVEVMADVHEFLLDEVPWGLMPGRSIWPWSNTDALRRAFLGEVWSP